VAATNTNVPGNPQGYNAAQHVINQRAVQREDNEKTVKALVDMGKAMEGAHTGLTRLTKAVQETDKIFERAARRGDLFAGRAMIDFYRTSDSLNKAFTKTYSTLGSGFSSLQAHGLKATSTLASHSKELLHFFELSGKQKTETVRLAEEEARINEEVTRQMRFQGGLIDEELKEKRDRLSLQKTYLASEKELLKVEKMGAITVAAFAATVGQALALSYEYQKTFKSIALDFKSSLGFIDNLVSVAASARGLASIADAAKAMTALRKAGTSYYADKDLQKSIIQLSSATDLSAESATALAQQFKILGGTTEEFKTLGNVFTFFSQQTELTADEVANLVTAAKPLITDFPKDLQSKTITSVLAVGDAFKKAGLNADELLKTLDEMKDFTSGEGMKSAAMIARFSGVSFAEMTRGTDVGLQAGAALTARYNFMKQMMSRGMGAATAASMGSKMGLGSAAELKIEGRWTPADLAARKEQIRTDEEEATAKEHLQDAINRLLSNPIARLVAMFHGLERFFLSVGTKALEDVTGFFDNFGKFLNNRGLLSPITDFFKMIGDIAANPVVGSTLTTIATTLLFALPINAAKTFAVFVRGFSDVIFKFAKLGTATSRVIQGLDEQIAANKRLALSSEEAAAATKRQTTANELSELAGGVGGGPVGGGVKGAASAVKAEEEAVAAGKATGFFSKLAGTVKGSKVGRVATGLGNTLKSKITGLAGGATGLLKFGGEWGLKFVPILGGIIGTVAGLTTAGSRIGEEGFNIKTAIQGVFDVVGGLLMGFGWVGAAISAVLMGLNSLIDWLFGSKKKEENKGTTVKPTTESQEAAASGTLGKYQFDTRGGKQTISTPGGTRPLGGNAGLHGGLSTTAAAANGGRGGGSESASKSSIYQKLLTAYSSSGLVNVIPNDGAKFGITTGSAEEWARFGTAVAEAESGFDPRSQNLSDPGGSFGVFQYAHGQVPGGNAFDIDSSVAAFVRDSVASQSDLESGLLGQRFSTIGRHPERTISKIGGVSGTRNVASSRESGGPPPPTSSSGGVATSRAIADVSSDTSTYQNPNKTAFPARLQAVGGVDPAAFIAHHTGGRGTVQSLQDTLHQRGLGVEFAMDREGNISQIGQAGAANILSGSKFFKSSDPRSGLSNKNIIGMEIIAKDDADITDAQRKSFAEFIAARYPNTPVLGHGEVNPGHKEADEGQSTSRAALALRSKLSTHVSTVQTPPPSTSISTRLFERHLRDLQKGDFHKLPDTQKEMLTEMKSSGRSSREYFSHQMRKDFLGPSLLPDSAEELYRVV
jgi:hypothetical protein